MSVQHLFDGGQVGLDRGDLIEPALLLRFLELPLPDGLDVRDAF